MHYLRYLLFTVFLCGPWAFAAAQSDAKTELNTIELAEAFLARADFLEAHSRLMELEGRRSELRRVASEITSLRDRKLIATTGGTITRINVLEGSYLVPGQSILQIGGRNSWSASLYLDSWQYFCDG